jgi:hypothetical protein
MESVGPDPTSPPQRSIDCLRNTYRQPLHAGAESARIVRFDEQMNVIGLHAELQEAKPGGGRSRQGSSHHAEYGVAAQRAELRSRPQRDVRWAPRNMPRPRTMRDCASPRARLSARAGTKAPPRSRSEHELLRHAAHLNRAYITASLLACQAVG